MKTQYNIEKETKNQEIVQPTSQAQTLHQLSTPETALGDQ